MAFLKFAHVLGSNKTDNRFDRTNCSFHFCRRKQFYQPCGLHVITYYNLIYKEPPLLDHSTQHLSSSPDWNLKLRRKYISKSGKTFKQHLSRWKRLLRVLLMKNSSSSPRKTMRLSQKNKTSNGKNNLQRKEGQNAMEWVADKAPSKLTTSVEEFTKVDGNATSYSMNWIKTNARIRVEQYVDLVLKNLKLKIQGQPYDEMLLTTNKRYKHYKTNEDRIIFKLAYSSGKTKEKLLASNTTNFSYQNN